MGGASVAVRRESGNEIVVCLGRTTARHWTLQAMQIRCALHSYLGIIPARRGVRAHDSITPGWVRKEHPRWRWSPAVLQCTGRGIRIEARDIVRTAWGQELVSMIVVLGEFILTTVDNVIHARDLARTRQNAKYNFKRSSHVYKHT